MRQRATIELRKGERIQNKYNGFADDIRNKIKKGTYTNKLPPLRELADEYDTHIITIRKALEVLGNEGLVVFRKGSGVYLNTDGPKTIGVIGSFREEFLLSRMNFSDDYFSLVLRPILARIEEGADIFSLHHKKEAVDYHELFKNNAGIDGCIVMAPENREREGLIRFARRAMLFIVIGSYFPDKEISCVDSDNREDSREAVERLIRGEHRRIAFLCNRPSSTTQNLRLQGYKDALLRHGIPYDPSLVIMANTPRKAFLEKSQRVLGLSVPPTAIFGASSNSVEKFLDLAGNRAKEFEVIVYDDLQNKLERFGIPYGVIVQPLTRIGECAIDALYGLINGSVQPPVRICLKSELVFKHPGGSSARTNR